MKFTLSWLKEHLDTDADIDAVAEAMTLAGLEVEAIENPAEKLSAFSVGKVTSAEKHPDADKLKICQVETRDGTKQIVCGAHNARAGMTAAYAPLGAYIPGLDFALDKKPRKIRGVESHGMMCSAKELEAGDDHDGIMDLPGDLEMGMPLADALGLNDPVIDFEVTPNRPDWLGVDNIARDLAATGLGTLKAKSVTPVKGTFPCPVAIKTDVPDACPVFTGRVVRGVKNGPSPAWLQARLKAIGLRPISALVDITNFITYDRARPLHFYDVAKLTGSITVRMGEDEKFAALDDKSYTATAHDTAITDDSGILGLGGIVGGESTGCGDDTTEILIESAYFDPMTIRKSAQRLGVQSDAKYRFERGVDTGFILDGLEMATQMVLEICGGEASEVVVAGEIPAAAAPIEFDPSLMERLTGIYMTDEQMKSILQTLDFKVEFGSDFWTVSVPTHRRDCTQGADLVEELARIYGLHKMEAKSLPPIKSVGPLATALQNKLRAGRRALAVRGLSESVTWSFVKADHAAAFAPINERLRLSNPISSDLEVMRPSGLIHLLLAGQKSADRGYPGSALFEAGPVYRDITPSGQIPCLAGARRIETARHWQGNSAPDAFTAKADVIAALTAMGANTANLQNGKPSGEYWHPGRSSRLQMGPKNILADFGELHPAVLKELGIDGRICAFEIWPDAIPAARKKQGKSRGALTMSDLMPVHRDFAFIVPADMAAATLLRAVKGADKKLISDVALFDIYDGEGIGGGQKSLAIDVTLAPSTETLTDKDIEAVTSKIIAQAAKTGAILRG